MRSRPEKHGFTLVEISVACFIALLLSASLGRLFYSSLGWQARALRQTSLRQQLKVAMQRIPADLQQSAPAGIAVSNNQVSIQRLADVSTDIPARLLWETRLSLYFVQGARLYRRDWPPEPPQLGITLNPAMPFRPDSTQLNLLCSQGRGQLMGGNVVSLELSSPRTLPLKLTVVVSEAGDRFSSTRTFSLRNAE